MHPYRKVHRGWEREKEDKPKSVNTQAEKDHHYLVFNELARSRSLLGAVMYIAAFVFVERFGIPESAACSNRLL